RIQTLSNAAYPARQGQWAQNSEFIYDTAPFGIGKPAQINSVDGIVKTFAYDSSSRLRGVDTVDEAGQIWPITFEDNGNGLTSAINYPASGTPFRIEYEYAQNGDLASIFNASSGLRLPIWSQVSKNVAGESTREKFGTTEMASFNYYDTFALRSQSAVFQGSN